MQSRDDTGAAPLLVVFADLRALRGAEPAALTGTAVARLIENLRATAAVDVHVAALITPPEGRATRVRSRAGGALAVDDAAFPSMRDPAVLASLLASAHAAHPDAPIVLALEGQGGGFIPEAPGDEALPISTAGVGRALAAAAAQGVPKIAVLWLAISFGLSIELLSAVMPHAGFAAGFPNHAFFSAGAVYPLALREQPQPFDAERVGTRLLHANRDVLAGGRHPTVGGGLHLSRMRQILECVDDLADALLAALRRADLAVSARTALRAAIRSSWQYDTESTSFGPPEVNIDLAGLARQLLREGGFGPAPVHRAARALADSLVHIWRYADSGQPWFSPQTRWDFSYDAHVMVAFMPDPACDGQWDWRGPAYLDPADSGATPFQRETAWTELIGEFLRHAPRIDAAPWPLPPMLHRLDGA